MNYNRRWFFEQCGVGLGAMAMNALAAANSQQPHFAPKAKRVIFLFMAGAPSHLELFDNKPQLAKFDGQLPPAELLKGYRAAFINPNSKLLGPKFPFAKYGQSGAELTDLLPHLSKVVDDITIVKSMSTDAFNHAPGQLLMNTGGMIFGRPFFLRTFSGISTLIVSLPWVIRRPASCAVRPFHGSRPRCLHAGYRLRARQR